MLIEGDKRDAQWGYLGVCGYMPLLGVLFETPVCPVDEFREGKVSPSAGQLEIYWQWRTRMPRGKRLARYRVDNASDQADRIKKVASNGPAEEKTAYAVLG